MQTGETIHFRGGRYALGEFHCPPGDWRWRAVNAIDETDAYVVFPGTSVVITQLGHEPVLTNRNHVVFYRRGQRFLRALHDPRGDHCSIVRIQPPFLAEVLAEKGHEEAGGDVPFVDSPGDSQAYLALSCVIRALRSRQVEALAVDEVVVAAVHTAVERALEHHSRRRRPARRTTHRDHHALVEDAKALLVERATFDDPLAALARRLHVSEFHLCRLFRQHTGFTLHRYRVHLRLRLALELLADSEVDVAAIAKEVGFARHSHFADAFRTAFGMSPSRARRTIGQRELHRLLRRAETAHDAARPAAAR